MPTEIEEKYQTALPLTKTVREEMIDTAVLVGLPICRFIAKAVENYLPIAKAEKIKELQESLKN